MQRQYVLNENQRQKNFYCRTKNTQTKKKNIQNQGFG